MLGNRIKQLRMSYNLSVNKFAKQCGLSSVAVYYLESEERKLIRTETIEKLVKTYFVSQDWLLLGEGEMLPQGKNNNLNKIVANPSNDKLIEELQLRNKFLSLEIERLWNLIEIRLKPNLLAETA